jgi:hypothetical protein
MIVIKMSRMHPELLDPEATQSSVAFDARVGENPEEDEEEDEGDDEENEDDGNSDGYSE